MTEEECCCGALKCNPKSQAQPWTLCLVPFLLSARHPMPHTNNNKNTTQNPGKFYLILINTRMLSVTPLVPWPEFWHSETVSLDLAVPFPETWSRAASALYPSKILSGTLMWLHYLHLMCLMWKKGLNYWTPFPATPPRPLGNVKRDCTPLRVMNISHRAITMKLCTHLAIFQVENIVEFSDEKQGGGDGVGDNKACLSFGQVMTGCAVDLGKAAVNDEHQCALLQQLVDQNASVFSQTMATQKQCSMKSPW